MKKELKERFKKMEVENKIEMKKWWDKILPRKGSLLRQLILRTLSNL